MIVNITITPPTVFSLFPFLFPFLSFPFLSSQAKGDKTYTRGYQLNPPPPLKCVAQFCRWSRGHVLKLDVALIHWNAGGREGEEEKREKRMTGRAASLLLVAALCA